MVAGVGQLIDSNEDEVNSHNFCLLSDADE
jgi:hypothetical protein